MHASYALHTTEIATILASPRTSTDKITSYVRHARWFFTDNWEQYILTCLHYTYPCVSHNKNLLWSGLDCVGKVVFISARQLNFDETKIQTQQILMIVSNVCVWNKWYSYTEYLILHSIRVTYQLID